MCEREIEREESHANACFPPPTPFPSFLVFRWGAAGSGSPRMMPFRLAWLVAALGLLLPLYLCGPVSGAVTTRSIVTVSSAITPRPTDRNRSSFGPVVFGPTPPRLPKQHTRSGLFGSSGGWTTSQKSPYVQSRSICGGESATQTDQSQGGMSRQPQRISHKGASRGLMVLCAIHSLLV